MSALGASGFASAAALLWLASNRIAVIPADTAAALLLAIQWHLVGLTIAKFGIDYAVFAIVSRNRELAFRTRDILFVPVLPCAGAFLAASLPLFSPLAALLLSAAVVVDALTTIQTAELNARRRFIASALGNILNYPVFVGVWWLLAARRMLSFEEVLTLFLLTRGLRYAWVAWRAAAENPRGQSCELSVKGWIGLQGVLNLLAFRSDQILLSVLLFGGVGWVSANSDLNLFVFLSRFPEIATGVLVIVGTVIFPRMHLVAAPVRRSLAELRYYGFLSVGVAATAAFAIAAGAPLFVGSPPTVAWGAAFVAQITLVLTANLITYSMQREGFLAGLIRNYALAVVVGAIVGMCAVVTRSLLLFAWIVPAQLATFIVISLVAPWGRRLAMFVQSEPI